MEEQIKMARLNAEYKKKQNDIKARNVTHEAFADLMELEEEGRRRRLGLGRVRGAIQGVRTMIIRRQWTMPNSNTFEIEPIKQLIQCYANGVIVDPFANSNKFGTITNDINPAFDTTYHLDATDFLKQLNDNCADVVLYDPPYSPRQVAECYKQFGQTVNMETTQASYWSEQKKEISRILKPNGICITCSWNSGGIGMKYGFEIIEILLVPHGGWHNDTIVTVERKQTLI
jgi:hypothetical protein